jgi:hypothetical protein
MDSDIQRKLAQGEGDPEYWEVSISWDRAGLCRAPALAGKGPGATGIFRHRAGEGFCVSSAQAGTGGGRPRVLGGKHNRGQGYHSPKL